MQHLQELNCNTPDRVGPENMGAMLLPPRRKMREQTGATHLVTDHGCGVAGNGDAIHLQETNTISEWPWARSCQHKD